MGGYDSASEGEIVESEGERKATTTQKFTREHDNNRSDRPRSRVSGSARPLHSDHDSDSQDYDNRSRSSRDRTPDRHQSYPHGVKRRYPDDHRNDRGESNGRRMKARQDDGRNRGGYGNHRESKQTLSHRQGGGSRRMSPDRYRRDIPREPPRGSREEASAVPRGPAGFGESAGPFTSAGAKARGDGEGSTRSIAPVQTSEDHEEAEAEELTPVDEATQIEERRKRREALRAKHSRETPLIQKALHATAAVSGNPPVGDGSSKGILSQLGSGNASTASSPDATSPMTPMPDSPGSPFNISVADDAELANSSSANDERQRDTTDGPSAADYDPSMDMQEDRVLDRNGEVVDTVERPEISRPGKPSKKKEDTEEFDMFADDVEDESPHDEHSQREDDGTRAVGGLAGKQLDKSMLDDWDDAEGYYRIILGEILDKRYQVQTNLGKGVFSAVIRAQDNKTGKLVAIKIIRKQESMYKAGLKEINTLERLAEADPEDKRHVIRLERYFMHKGHLCMVFEHLSINLREVLKKFGRDVGINIKAVRAYAHQIFLGLSLLKKCDVLHADLKPDNVLVNENRSQLKIADLGSAFDVQDSEVTDVLVSRFYRAPEIMLGIKGDFALDMWSIGCTLFELYTGRICFTGATNNQMLKGIMECRGRIPNRVLKKAEYWAQHFDADGTFLSQEYDSVTRKEVVRRININRPVPAKELKARLFANSRNLSVADAKELNIFADLLDKCLAVDPAKRITPNDALRHGFINRSSTPAAPAPSSGAVGNVNKGKISA